MGYIGKFHGPGTFGSSQWSFHEIVSNMYASPSPNCYRFPLRFLFNRLSLLTCLCPPSQCSFRKSLCLIIWQPTAYIHVVTISYLLGKLSWILKSWVEEKSKYCYWEFWINERLRLDIVIVKFWINEIIEDLFVCLFSSSFHIFLYLKIASTVLFFFFFQFNTFFFFLNFFF